MTTSTDRRLLCVLPHLPDRSSGGGLLLHEILVFLATRGRVAAAVPAYPEEGPACAALRQDPELAGIDWLPLEARRRPGLGGRIARLLAPVPAEVFTIAVEGNHRRLEALRREFAPTTELAVSSWALAAYRRLAPPPATRLYMVNVDPAIVTAAGRSAWRRIAAAIDRPKVERLCRRALAAAGRVGSISAADLPALGRLGGRSDVAHVPPLMRPRPVDRGRVEPGTVLVTTNFTYPQNVVSLEWFFRACWPHVDPAARLTVTGRDVGGRLAALCAGQPRTAYAGCLDVAGLDAAFARTAVAVNPTRSGSGFQIKLLDAVARGVPIVSTAFSNRLGPAIASSDDPRELADLVSARLRPGAVPPLDYAAFHRAAVAAWDAFLFAD